MSFHNALTPSLKSVSSPLRNSQLSSNSSSQNSLIHDDNAERAQRRSLIGPKKAALTPNVTIQNTDETQIQDHFQLCIKMCIENKINTKNVWGLKVIDFMEKILHSQVNKKGVLNVGVTSLDVSSKVYSLKVDDIYTNGIQIAGSMTRSEVKNDERESAEDDEKENENPKVKKRTKRNTKKFKNTVLKDVKSITGNIPKLDCNYFQTKSGVNLNSSDILFTNTLQMNPFDCRLILLSSEKTWISNVQTSPQWKEQSNKKYPWPLKLVGNLEICKAFSAFEITNWNPNEEESYLAQQSFDNVVFNDKGLPVAELDGSVHDVFADEDNIDNDEEVENIEKQYRIRNDPEQIMSFRPEEHNTVCNEYSYAYFSSVENKNSITQMWAGPSHWKLKYIRPTTSKFSGINHKEPLEKGRKRNHKLINLPIDFNNSPELQKAKYKPRKLNMERTSNKFTLPENYNLQDFSNLGIKLSSKPLIIFPKKISKKSDNVEEDLPYNYDNPNDSQYCCENIEDSFDSADQNVSGNSPQSYQNNDEEEIQHIEKHDNYMGENLVSVPQLAQKNFIPYALTAKKLDIKRLKNSVWKCLVGEMLEENKIEKVIEPILFSTVFKSAPNFVPKKMRDEVSLPVTFVALLHLVNEHNLEIEQGGDDLRDFHIKKNFK